MLEFLFFSENHRQEQGIKSEIYLFIIQFQQKANNFFGVRVINFAD